MHFSYRLRNTLLCALVVLFVERVLPKSFVQSTCRDLLGRRLWQAQAKPAVALQSSKGAGGVKGQDIDEAALALQKERAALAEGRAIDKRLMRLRTADDFIGYAKLHGASVTSTSKGRMRISKNGVWRDVAGQGRRVNLMNSEKKKMIIAYKAMDIAFQPAE